MQRIALFDQDGHQLLDELENALAQLHQAHIDGRIDRTEPGCGIGILWIEESKMPMALRVLRDQGFDVTELPRGHHVCEARRA